jgi:prepilin signal peptidase PulO-like enzyme (type II secretory pathway)
LIILIIFFLAGTIWGSFLGVIIERLYWSKNKWHLDLFSPSHCEHCQHKLSAIDLVPIFSFLGQKGKCRYCKKSINWRIFLVEILTGLIFALAYFNFSFSLNFVFAIILASILIIILFYDIKEQLVPDPLILILFLVFLIKIIFDLAPIFYTQINFWQPVLGALIITSFFALIYAVTRGKGMGLGDLKLGLTLGLFLGIKMSILLLWLTFFVGGTVGLIILVLKLKKAKDRIAFAPFLIFAFMIIYFLPSVVNWFSSLW